MAAYVAVNQDLLKNKRLVAPYHDAAGSSAESVAASASAAGGAALAGGSAVGGDGDSLVGRRKMSMTGPLEGALALDAAANPSKHFGQDCLVGVSASVGEKTTVKHSIVGSHCKIGNNCKIANCIIMDHCTIKDE
jgi:hypothetical protein